MEKLCGGSMKIIKWNALYILSISMMFSAIMASESLLNGLTSVTENYKRENSGNFMPVSDIYDYIVKNKYESEEKDLLLESKWKDLIISGLKIIIISDYKSEMPLQDILEYIIKHCNVTLEVIELEKKESEATKIHRVEETSLPDSRSVFEVMPSVVGSVTSTFKEVKKTINFPREFYIDPTISHQNLTSNRQSIEELATGNFIQISGNGVFWMTLKMPLFSNSGLLEIYSLFYSLVRLDIGLQTLLHAINNCGETLPEHFNNEYLEPRVVKISSRRTMNSLIGERAVELLKDANLNWKDKLRLELLERYFYQLEYELEGTENSPFTLDELIRFRDEAIAIEAMRIKPASSAEKKFLAGALTILGGTAAYSIATLNNPNVFDPAVDFVTKALPSAALLSNLQNFGQSAFNNLLGNMPSLSFGGAINGMSGLFNR
jgi:hypothetical protein